MRVGQALGLRHADFVSHRRELRIVPRADNANGARAKTLDTHTIPISAGLARLYTAYMFDEYGECESDYVFVNLFAEPYGRPLRYQAVHQLVRRLRARTGIEFTLHMLRHSRATDLLRHGVGVDVVARLLTHRSSTTTSQTYIHLDVEDLRAELDRCGAWADGRPVVSAPMPAEPRPQCCGRCPRPGPSWRTVTPPTPGGPRAGGGRRPRPGRGQLHRDRRRRGCARARNVGPGNGWRPVTRSTRSAPARARSNASRPSSPTCSPPVEHPAEIDRPLLERYLRLARAAAAGRRDQGTVTGVPARLPRGEPPLRLGARHPGRAR